MNDDHVELSMEPSVLMSPEKTRFSLQPSMSKGGSSSKKFDDIAGNIFSGIKTISKSDRYRITNSHMQSTKLASKLKEPDLISVGGFVPVYEGTYAATGFRNSEQTAPLTERKSVKVQQEPEGSKSATRLTKKPNMTSMILKALQKNPSQYLHTKLETEQSDSCIFGINRQ